MLEKVNQLLHKEIKYISKFYPCNIKNYFDLSLLYSKGMLVLNFGFNKLSPSNSRKNNIKINSHNNSNNSEILFHDKLVNLMAGIELLGLGTDFHTFNINFLKNFIIRRSKVDQNEKKYTLELLFGDIFYCRAIFYLLKYRDFSTLDIILEALKTVNYNKLLLSSRIIELLKGELSFEDLVVGDINLLLGINSLFKTSLIFGLDLFSDDSKRSNFNCLLDIMNSLVLLKSYKDLMNFYKLLHHCGDNNFGIVFLIRQRNCLRDKLINILSSLKPEWLANNFRLLLKDLWAI